jgi:hypothetical protein
MNEQLLHDVLVGAQKASTLNGDLVDAVVATGPTRSTVRIIDCEAGDHEVTAEQIMLLCDAVRAGELEPSHLETVASCLISSDYFHWDSSTVDGGRVATVLHDWSSQEIGEPLTRPNIAKARHFLATGNHTFTPDDLETHLGSE